MSISKNEYVIVNLWTSKKNNAVPGINCGHASLTAMVDGNETYISLWPGANKPYKSDHQPDQKLGFFPKKEVAYRSVFSDFVARPTSYKQDYEQDCISEAVSEGAYAEITHIDHCRYGETAYKVNTDNYTFERLDIQPRGFRPNEFLWAIKLVPANFRMVLYAINLEKILVEFDRLSQPDCVTGWSMAGSNLLTRNLGFSETSENCASIAYRCLIAGGLFSNISSKLSLQPSSAVAPDDLLRIIVAAKTNELGLYTGNQEDWKVQGVDETSLEKLKNAYLQVDQNANAEDDKIQSIKPSVVGCALF